MRDKETGNSRGMALVVVDADKCDKAIADNNGADFQGRTLRVAMSTTPMPTLKEGPPASDPAGATAAAAPTSGPASTASSAPASPASPAKAAPATDAPSGAPASAAQTPVASGNAVNNNKPAFPGKPQPQKAAPPRGVWAPMVDLDGGWEELPATRPLVDVSQACARCRCTGYLAGLGLCRFDVIEAALRLVAASGFVGFPVCKGMRSELCRCICKLCRVDN
ncbi:hypothetical protein VOLCADRAFT_104350 [Volvox carteri f. nagariensis]|uniref:RRM domain-containing protein n=1 Tax=Volvox carteri f. nagariensis TaxID=3068 RepID=D8TT56_VOLCA|nr:uncharacterized protein VOLCADRAFT_104350 [Volvox carteri f. nagariensis]EFJ49136.1 hypothetical protein VOLCADRAFT_104350 [Volvox carteri f. nagariensis]|eukprot:XP_002949584.1 hypothetical protein VOLCADRAFT_104350 [Volvox carteri f. nagariensis]